MKGSDQGQTSADPLSSASHGIQKSRQPSSSSSASSLAVAGHGTMKKCDSTPNFSSKLRRQLQQNNNHSNSHGTGQSAQPSSPSLSSSPPLPDIVSRSRDDSYTPHSVSGSGSGSGGGGGRSGGGGDVAFTNNHIVVSRSSESGSSEYVNVNNNNNGIFCPICNDQFVNLAQLNQHIDDEHEETIDPAEQIISWFKKTQKRVISPFKRANSTSTTSNRNSVTAGSSSSNPINLIANTLNILQQPEKLISGLQTAGGFVEQSSSSSSKSMHGGNVGTMQGSPAVPTGYSSSGGESDPETGVSRSHWQRETINDFCSIEGCGKSLGLRNGKVNCRKCGRLHCDTHSLFQMKLDRTCLHSPETGIWCRVCQSCYQCRDGYLDSFGRSNNITREYTRVRRDKIGHVLLEVNMLEKRLEKLTRLHVDFAAAGKKGPLHQASIKASEQGISPWQEDNSVTACPECSVTFKPIISRRHHCRLCGRVVCGLPTCSLNIPIFKDEASESEENKVGETKICTRCKLLVFRRREVEKEKAHPPPLVIIYKAITELKAIVEEKLPVFNKMILSLRAKAVIYPEDQDYHVAAKLRKVLLDNLTLMEKYGKKIKMLPSSNPSTLKLQTNIHVAIINYLQANMFTLQLIPKVTSSNSTPTNASSNDITIIPTLTIQELDALDAARKQLVVLSDQKELIDRMIAEATKRRQLEDVSILQENVRDIEAEIEVHRRLIDKMKVN